MAGSIKKPQGEPIKYPPGDVTKPWRRQFFEVKSIGDEPALNTKGFWKKPKHGLLEGKQHAGFNRSRK